MRLLSTNQLFDALSHQFINQLAKFGLAVAGLDKLHLRNLPLWVGELWAW